MNEANTFAPMLPAPHPLPSRTRHYFLRQVALSAVSNLAVTTLWVTATGQAENSRGQGSSQPLSARAGVLDNDTKYLLRISSVPGTGLGTIKLNYLL